MLLPVCFLPTLSGIRWGSIGHFAVHLPPGQWCGVSAPICGWHRPYSLQLSTPSADDLSPSARVCHEGSRLASSPPGYHSWAAAWQYLSPAVALYSGYLGACWDDWLQAVLHSSWHLGQGLCCWGSFSCWSHCFPESGRCTSVPHLHPAGYLLRRAADLSSYAWSPGATPRRAEADPPLPAWYSWLRSSAPVVCFSRSGCLHWRWLGWLSWHAALHLRLRCLLGWQPDLMIIQEAARGLSLQCWGWVPRRG